MAVRFEAAVTAVWQQGAGLLWFHATIAQPYQLIFQERLYSMYVFSANARTPKAIDGFAAGADVPFILYINFKDLYGAEQLCRLYLLQEGFESPAIDKRKLIEAKFLSDSKLIDADPALKEALESGYSIQVFSAH